MTDVWVVSEPGWDHRDILGVYDSIETIMRLYPKGKWKVSIISEDHNAFTTTDRRTRYLEADRYEVKK